MKLLKKNDRARFIIERRNTYRDRPSIHSPAIHPNVVPTVVRRYYRRVHAVNQSRSTEQIWHDVEKYGAKEVAITRRVPARAGEPGRIDRFRIGVIRDTRTTYTRQFSSWRVGPRAVSFHSTRYHRAKREEFIVRVGPRVRPFGAANQFGAYRERYAVIGARRRNGAPSSTPLYHPRDVL